MNRRHFLYRMGGAAVGGLTLSSLGFPARGMGLLRPEASGVKIGAISYSFREIPSSAEQILEYMVELGLDTVELIGSPAEEYAGAPPAPRFPRNWRELSDDERAAFRAARDEADKEARAWRLKAPMDKFEALGKAYRDAGVHIDILKLGNPGWTDEEIDYAFRAARAVGARGISFEISNEAGERMGPFATKHELVTGMHNHTQVADEDFSFDIPLSYSPFNMINLDIGHYVAGLGTSPIPVIEKYHDRITHLHLKDRRSPDNGAENVPWGEGDTPIGETLRLLRDKEYPIPAMIELEYPVPEGSTVMEEMKKCVAYCKDALS